jgi:5-methylcytosine-specific restriction endonuclease McrA
MKRTPIRKFSQKQLKRQREIAKLKKPTLCEICFKKAPLDWHHKIHRSQGGTDTRDNLIACCRLCHTRIHEGNFEPQWRIL